MNNKILYIVWYPYARRAETVSRELQAKLVFIYEPRLRTFWLNPLRYLVQCWRTWRLLEQERPAFVIVQSPPIFAPLAVALWCKLRGRKQVSYILDCHPSTFYNRRWQWAFPLLRWLARNAVVSLLCNEDAQKYLAQWQANYIFLPDGLPDLSSFSNEVPVRDGKSIAVVSAFAHDEPVGAIFKAARLTPDVTFYVTGATEGMTNELLANKPENIVLTGFLRGSAYNGLLHNVQGVMILGIMITTLSCGAFEALSLAKPSIVSDLPEQRRLFSNGFLLVENTPEDIAQAVETLLNEHATYVKKAEILRAEYIAVRRPKLEKLISLLEHHPARSL
ncbi:MAG TPA: glycosyltransferase [Ktedonobacteraceae bacterium]|nr:glycosyltransferase [Ktedonobacteraceae bacterium]